MRLAWRRSYGVGLGAVLMLVVGLVLPVPSFADGGAAAVAPAERPARLISLDRHGMTLELRPGLTLRSTARGAVMHGSGGFLSFFSSGVMRIDGTLFGIGLQGFEGPSDPPGLLVSMGRALVHGNRTAFQIHSYEVDLPPHALTISKDLTTAHLDTGDALGRWGRIDMTFHPAGDPVARCGGLNIRQRGTSGGSFSFTPHADNGFFGTVVRSAFDHAVVSVRAGCNGGGGGVSACPRERFFVDVDDELANADATFVGTDLGRRNPNMESAVYQQWSGDFSVLHEIVAMVPRGSVQLTGGWSARLSTVPDSFLSGSARYTSRGRTYRDGPHPCGHQRSWTLLERQGVTAGASGDLLTELLDTGSVSIPNEPRHVLSSLIRLPIR